MSPATSLIRTAAISLRGLPGVLREGLEQALEYPFVDHDIDAGDEGGIWAEPAGSHWIENDLPYSVQGWILLVDRAGPWHAKGGEVVRTSCSLGHRCGPQQAL